MSGVRGVKSDKKYRCRAVGSAELRRIEGKLLVPQCRRRLIYFARAVMYFDYIYENLSHNPGEPQGYPISRIA